MFPKGKGGRIDPHTFISPSIDLCLQEITHTIFRGLSTTSHDPHVIIIKQYPWEPLEDDHVQHSFRLRQFLECIFLGYVRL